MEYMQKKFYGDILYKCLKLLLITMTNIKMVEHI